MSDDVAIRAALLASLEELLGPDQAGYVLERLNQMTWDNVAKADDLAVVKTDVADLKTSVAVLDVRMTEGFARVDASIKAEIGYAFAAQTRALMLTVVMATFGTVGLNLAISQLIAR